MRSQVKRKLRKQVKKKNRKRIENTLIKTVLIGMYRENIIFGVYYS